MRLGISNIAWDVTEDAEVAALLERLGVDAVDIAPGKYFPVPSEATSQQIEKVKGWWASRGIELTGMQALLFGTTGLNVFGSPDSQSALLKHLTAICRIGSGLGATRIVFGSPKNRDRTGLSDEQALETASRFFRQVGQAASEYGVIVCLEPNPPCYQANFMTDAADTASVVRLVDNPAIRMQFDTGALAINGEDPELVLKQHGDLIGHVHASEPNLVTVGEGGTEHATMARALRAYTPESIVTVEMVASQNEPHLASIERALNHAMEHYGPEQGGASQ